MVKEYGISYFYKLLLLVALVFCVVLTCLLVHEETFSKDNNLNTIYLIISIGFLFFFYCIYDLVKAYTSVLRFTPNEISVTSFFRTKRIRKSTISGYRVVNKDYLIFSHDSNYKTLEISRFFENQVDWQSNLTEFINLDDEEHSEEVNELFNDKAFGNVLENRVETISDYRKKIKLINIPGALVGLWLLLYPHPYEIITGLAYLTITIAFALVILKKGQITLFGSNLSLYPSVSTAILLPFGGIAVRSMLDYNISAYSPLWTITFIITPILTFLFFKVDPSLKKSVVERPSNVTKAILYFLISIPTGVFIFFIVLSINCTYDRSITQAYKVQVLSVDKHESSKRRTTYSMDVSPWKTVDESKEVRISNEYFSQLEIGDSVYIGEKKGLFSIPWYFHINLSAE